MSVLLITSVKDSTDSTKNESQPHPVWRAHKVGIQQQIRDRGGQLLRQSEEHLVALFETDTPLLCALEIQKQLTAARPARDGPSPICVGLHAGSITPEDATAFSQMVTCTNQLVAAGWGGQILLTSGVAQVAAVPPQATLKDLGEHLLYDTRQPQQVYTLVHPDLPAQEYPPLRSLSGSAIGRLIQRHGQRLKNLAPSALTVGLVSATLVPALLGNISPASPALAGVLGVLGNLGVETLSGFVGDFVKDLHQKQQAGHPLPSETALQQELEQALLARWEADDPGAIALRTDASQLLQAVHGLEAALYAATDDLRQTLIQGFTHLGTHLQEFHWMLDELHRTQTEILTRQTLQLAMQEEQLALQREQMAKTDLLLTLQQKQKPAKALSSPSPKQKPVSQPTGTVTFLFTDIEGSTRLWEQFPAAMQTASARHDAILEQAILQHHGYIVKTTGDGFHAAFANPLDAVQATVAAQRALLAEDWGPIGTLRARMALHTGTAEPRAGDYFSPAVNRAARLMSAGHGGQILLSLTTVELIRDTLPEDLAIRDLGEYYLRDLQRPERIFQLVSPDLPADFPPLKTLDNRPNNLPIQPTPLIGRARALATIKDWLTQDNVRLVTLTGPGGAGKTRLSLQIAADLLDRFRDGVFFVALATLTDPALVLPAIAQTLGVQEQSGRPLGITLQDYLREREILLVLDNFEQILPAAVEIAGILAACPRLKVLATSRERLRLQGEQEFSVPPLSTPNLQHLSAADDVDWVAHLSGFEAVQLFVQRAQAARPDFRITPENAASIAEICIRLDGLPLALELAAARIKLLTPQAMLARLSNRLKLLRGGARDLPARHQTLQQAIAWSYDLLNELEKTLFQRLAVFAGSFSLEAAEIICSDDPDAASAAVNLWDIDVLDGVTSLVEKSLLRQIETGDGEPRLAMLETVREFGLTCLAASGEETRIRQAHVRYYLSLAEEAEPALRGPEQDIWLERLEAEHDNLRTALQWAITSHDTETALRLSGALWWFWAVRGHLTEGREWLTQVLALEDLADHPAEWATVLNGAGVLAYYQRDYAAAQARWEECLALRRKMEDSAGIASVLNNLGLVAKGHGDYNQARTFYEESAALSRALGDDRRMAAAIDNLGVIAYQQGDYETAHQLFNESLAIRRRMGDKGGIASTLNNLGIVAFEQEDYETARAAYEESLALSRELGDKRGIASTLHNLGNVVRRLGDPQRAQTLYQESLALNRELGDKRGLSSTLNTLGMAAYEEGKYAKALEWLGESLRIRRQHNIQRGIAESLESFACVAGAMQQHERMVCLASAAAALRQAIHAPIPPTEQTRLHMHLNNACLALGEEALARILEKGQSMTVEEAITYALSTTI